MVGYLDCLLVYWVPLGPLHPVILLVLALRMLLDLILYLHAASAWQPFWDPDDVEDMIR